MLTTEQRLDRLEMLAGIKKYPELELREVTKVRSERGIGIIPAREVVMLNIFKKLDEEQKKGRKKCK